MFKVKKECAGAYVIKTEKFTIMIDSPRINEGEDWLLVCSSAGKEYGTPIFDNNHWAERFDTKKEAVAAAIAFLKYENQ